MQTTAPFSADRPHRLRPDIFRILFALAGILNYNYPFCSERRSYAAATTSAKIANAFEWPGQPPKIAFSPGGSAPPSSTWFLWPTRVFAPAISSFNRPTHGALKLHNNNKLLIIIIRHLDRFSRFCTAYRRVSHYFTMGRCVFPKIPFFFGVRAPI